MPIKVLFAHGLSCICTHTHITHKHQCLPTICIYQVFMKIVDAHQVHIHTSINVYLQSLSAHVFMKIVDAHQCLLAHRRYLALLHDGFRHHVRQGTSVKQLHHNLQGHAEESFMNLVNSIKTSIFDTRIFAYVRVCH